MHWKENFERVVGFCQEAREANTLCWMFTIVGSTHLAMTDFAVLYPHWMSFFMKSMVNPLRACSLTIATSLEFLDLTLPPEHIKQKTWVNEDLLLSAPAPSEPEEHFFVLRLRVTSWETDSMTTRNRMSCGRTSAPNMPM
jgi:platelet-activating factor acetylhydrolase